MNINVSGHDIAHSSFVARVTRASGLTSSGQTVPVVLSVDPAQVLSVVQALADGPLDLVRVPDDRVPALVAPTPVA